jgi:hypothetical protein
VGSISLTPNTLDVSTLFSAVSVHHPQAGTVGGGGFNAILPPARYNLAAPTNISMVTFATFSVSTMRATGTIAARRFR